MPWRRSRDSKGDDSRDGRNEASANGGDGGDGRPDVSQVQAFSRDGTVYIRSGHPIAVAVKAHERYLEQRDPALLREAVVAAVTALSSCGENPELNTAHRTLRYELLRSASAVEVDGSILGLVVMCGYTAVNRIYPRSANYQDEVLFLAEALLAQWERDEDRDALAAAVRVLREAVRARPDEDPALHGRLADVLPTQATLDRDLPAFTEAVEAARVAVRRTAPGTADHARRLLSLGRAHVMRSAFRHGPLAEMDKAIALFRQALDIMPGDNDRRATAQRYLQNALNLRGTMTAPGYPLENIDFDEDEGDMP